MLQEYFSDIWRDRFILWALTQDALKIKYNKSVLGVAWSVLVPLGLVIIIGGVYGILFNQSPSTFVPVLFTGLNTWIFISGCADGGTNAFISAEGYIKQTTVNIVIFPIKVVLVAFINLLYAICAYLFIYLFLGIEHFSLNMLMVIPGLFLLFIFSIGLANITSVVNLTIRDFQPLQSLLLQGFFYATPIIFLPSMLASRGYAFVYEYNPFHYFIAIIRIPLLGDAIPTGQEYLIASLLAISVLFISIFIILREKHTGVAFKL